ncbi:MAG TPA: hypothetical protein VLK56_05460 [Solirubrobacterales bacterium]|nr:hypothetical protein [Solirubrobacterales bacterium]
MRGRSALAGIVALAAFLGPTAADAAAVESPSAPALLSTSTQAREELALLGQESGPLGLPGRTTLSELKFTNSDGYAISVVAFGQTVALRVSREHGRGDRRNVQRSSSTTYLAHGKVTSSSIRASFADRGRIAVRFRPVGRPIRATRKAGCQKSGDGVIGEPGLFVGELRFRGEDGYTTAEVHRIHGGSTDFAALIACVRGAARPGQHALLPAPQPPLHLPALGAVAQLQAAGPPPAGVRTHPSHRPKRTTLIADDKLPVSRTVFEAELLGTGRAQFAALEEGSEGSIGIVRYANATGPRSAFTFDDSLASATVAPPAPFSGDGAFRHDAGNEKSWTGSLAVSFLGARSVPLTGSPFRTLLVQSWQGPRGR